MLCDECELGTVDGVLRCGNVNEMVEDISMRINPVLNGIETDRFRVMRDNEAQKPTAVMLSHVYELKGVKDAIKAAAIIVNDYGINDYRLLIYGSLNKDPAYVSECRHLIGSNNMSSNVKLMGFGNATKVLTEGWIFVNSSLSEGLPLALGEAGLAAFLSFART